MTLILAEKDPGKPGKAGRGAEGKIPFVVAVATRDGKPIHAQVRLVPGFTKEAIQDYASANIARGSLAVSDGLGCFPGLADAGLRHIPIVTGGGRPTNPLVQMGQHDAWQYQECDHRHLPQRRHPARRTLSGRL